MERSESEQAFQSWFHRRWNQADHYGRFIAIAREAWQEAWNAATQAHQRERVAADRALTDVETAWTYYRNKMGAAADRASFIDGYYAGIAHAAQAED